MGFIKLLLNANNEEGCREGMRLAYMKHVKMANRGHISRDGTTPHQVGLYGALFTRYVARGIPRNIADSMEYNFWAELSPFMVLLDTAEALNTLIEYVLYQESMYGDWEKSVIDHPTEDVDMELLEKIINEAVSLILDIA